MYKAKLIALFVTASILGCGEDSGPTASNMGVDPAMVVGTWLDYDGDEWTFNSDGTFLDYEGDEGTWSVEGDVMTWTMSGVDLSMTFSVGESEIHLTTTFDDGSAETAETSRWKRKR